MKDPIPIPPTKTNVAFWDSMTPEETEELFTTGELRGAALERFWRLNDFQGPVPAAIRIEVPKSDVDRLIRELKRERRLEEKARKIATSAGAPSKRRRPRS
jgi:hypothetical protein